MEVNIEKKKKLIWRLNSYSKNTILRFYDDGTEYY